MQPHRWQPTRLPCPWDSPGKNTGVGHHFLFQCMKVKSESEVTQSCPTVSDPMDCSPPGSSVHGSFHARVLEWEAIAFSKVQDYWQAKFLSLSQLMLTKAQVGRYHQPHLTEEDSEFGARGSFVPRVQHQRDRPREQTQGSHPTFSTDSTQHHLSQCRLTVYYCGFNTRWGPHLRMVFSEAPGQGTKIPHTAE